MVCILLSQCFTFEQWVTSISGPEGIVAAQSTGSLLLASGLAGTLNNCLVAESEEASLVFANLFMPHPTMVLMIGARSNADSWTYTDFLSDRLHVMLPLVPGFVMSLVHGGEPCQRSLEVLAELMSAVHGSFHRVFSVLLQNCMATQGGKTAHALNREELLSAASDFMPHVLLVVVWIEYHIRNHQGSLDDPTVVYLPLKHQQHKGQSDSSWVDVTVAAFSESEEDLVLDEQLKQQQKVDETDWLKKLRSSQKSVLSIVTDLILTTMTFGGSESSTRLWRSVLATLRDSTNYIGGRKPQDAHELSRDLVCRLTSIVLTKSQNESSCEFEIWTAELSGAVARVCDMIEEKEILKKSSSETAHTRDQILLVVALTDALRYGREVTGWCQLSLPPPPEPSTEPQQHGSASPALPEETIIDFDGTCTIDEGNVDESKQESNVVVHAATDIGRHVLVRHQVPGSCSKMMLPVLRPAFRVIMSSLADIDPVSQVIVPPAINCRIQSGSFQPSSLLHYVVQELKQTFVAAIVGLTFPNARDMALHGLTSLRRMLRENSGSSGHCTTLSELLLLIAEELRVRYEGERIRREKALFDAYDDDGESAGDEAESSQEVERIILGGDLIPRGSPMLKTQLSEEITFEAGGKKKEDSTKGNGMEDFVMFNESYESILKTKARSALLGWDQLKVSFEGSISTCAVGSY